LVDLEENGTKVLLTFLSKQPQASKIEELTEYVKSPEELVVKNKEVYLFCPNGYGKTKLSNAFIERKLDVIATTRNWKSICKLNGLANEPIPKSKSNQRL